jgi:hypothetical protein
MVEKVFTAFIGLVGLYFVLMYPDRVVDFLQLFVDTAHHIAQALANLNVHSKDIQH